MDANRFDTLSRQVGTVGTRRGVLRLVGALPLLGALASLTSEQTGAETPLDRVGDRAEQHQQRQDRKDRHEQRKGKRNDGGGDQKNDGPSLRGVSCPAGTVELPNGSCAIACTFEGFPVGSNCPNDLARPPSGPGPQCACQPFEALGQQLCMVVPPTLDQGCRTTEDCAPGSACSQGSGPFGGNVCVALCALPAA